MKTYMARLFALGGLLAMFLATFASGANAEDATPVGTPEAIEISVGFYYCYDSSTPGITDWLAFSDVSLASTSTCNVVFGAEVDPSQTISIYDAATDELLETLPFSIATSQWTLALPGSYYFVESQNGTTSPVYTVNEGESFNVNALAHIGTVIPTPVETPTTTDFDIHAVVCEPSTPSESGKLLVTAEHWVPSSISAADASSTVACSYSTQPQDLTSIGAYYLETTGYQPSAESSYGPFTSLSEEIDDLPTGTYVVRLVRNNGAVQVSEPFPVDGESQVELFIYTGEEVTPTATATATATTTATTTATVTSTSTSVAPTATGTITALPNTGSGDADSDSLLFALSGFLVLILGSMALVFRGIRRQ